MICVQLMGGLGNQLFQYAFMRHIEELKFPDVCLDLHWFDKEKERGEEYQRVLEIDRFQTVYRAINCHGRSPCSRIIYQTEGDYSDLQLIGGDVFLCGWWADLDYMAYITEELRKECILKPEYVDEDMARIADKIRHGGENTVSLHIRRTDYLAPVNSTIFAQCPVSYYETAVRNIAAALGTQPVLYVFSDDTAWVKEHFRDFCGYETHIVETGAGYKDYYLMGKTRHHVIANSTFSWWAAFTAENQTGITVAPEKWYVDRLSPNLYLPEWIVL